MQKRVGAVDNAIAILNFLAMSRGGGLRLRDIARGLDMNTSTCLSILRTLVDHDVVSVDLQTKRYSIGNYFQHLQMLVEERDSREIIGAERMSELARSLDAVVTVWHQADERTLTLTSVFESGGEMTISARLGLSRPIYFGSIGRLFAAVRNPPEAELRKACLSYAWQHPPTPEEYLESVREAREKGYSVDDGFAVRGITTIAVPLREPDGSVRRCVSAGMLQVRCVDPHYRQRVISALFEIQGLLEAEKFSIEN